MSGLLIEEGITVAKNMMTWTSVLIEYDHSRKPNEYTCYDMNFSPTGLLPEIITDMCDAFLSIVEKRDKKVMDYTGESSDRAVFKLSTNNSIVSTCWNALIEHINSSDDNTDLKKVKAKAYVFIGCYTLSDGTSENIYLITRKNPILTFKKNRIIYISQNNSITKANEPMIQLSKSFDAMVYKNNLYMVNNNCESIFNMEYTYKIICKKGVLKIR